MILEKQYHLNLYKNIDNIWLDYFSFYNSVLSIDNSFQEFNRKHNTDIFYLLGSWVLEIYESDHFLKKKENISLFLKNEHHIQNNASIKYLLSYEVFHWEIRIEWSTVYLSWFNYLLLHLFSSLVGIVWKNKKLASMIIKFKNRYIREFDWGRENNLIELYIYLVLYYWLNVNVCFYWVEGWFIANFFHNQMRWYMGIKGPYISISANNRISKVFDLDWRSDWLHDCPMTYEAANLLRFMQISPYLFSVNKMQIEFNKDQTPKTLTIQWREYDLNKYQKLSELIENGDIGFKKHKGKKQFISITSRKKLTLEF